MMYFLSVRYDINQSYAVSVIPMEDSRVARISWFCVSKAEMVVVVMVLVMMMVVVVVVVVMVMVVVVMVMAVVTCNLVVYALNQIYG